MALATSIADIALKGLSWPINKNDNFLNIYCEIHSYSSFFLKPNNNDG